MLGVKHTYTRSEYIFDLLLYFSSAFYYRNRLSIEIYFLRIKTTVSIIRVYEKQNKEIHVFWCTIFSLQPPFSILQAMAEFCRKIVIYDQTIIILYIIADDPNYM